MTNRKKNRLDEVVEMLKAMTAEFQKGMKQLHAERYDLEARLEKAVERIDKLEGAHSIDEETGNATH